MIEYCITKISKSDVLLQQLFSGFDNFGSVDYKTSVTLLLQEHRLVATNSLTQEEISILVRRYLM